ncbi:hypothetical protein LINPERHAP2_LOCUS23562 [Linum perenne]
MFIYPTFLERVIGLLTYWLTWGIAFSSVPILIVL